MDAGVSDQRQESGENSRALTGDPGDTSAEGSSSLSESEVQVKTQVGVPWGVDDFV